MILGIIIVALFVLCGILAGQHIIIPYSSYQYVAVAILACLDSVFGALAASTGKKFNMKIFLSGFFFNAIFAMFLVYLGQLLNVEIYLAAVIVFGGRILNNFSIIRRDIMDKAQAQRRKIRKDIMDKAQAQRRKIRKQNIATNKTIKTDLEAEQEEIDNDIL